MKLEPLCGKTHDEIGKILLESGFNTMHARKVSLSLYRNHFHGLFSDPDIPSALKKLLKDNFETGVISPMKSVRSADGTVKYLFTGFEGKMFETVYIPDNKRHTVCVSTQSGCRMGCPFCVTGAYGFYGNLSVQEIISQVIGIPEGEKITHVVFMGMGEPLDNLAATIKAVGILTSEWGLALGNGHVTVSTVGLINAVKELLNSTRCNLTLSLFSPFSDERKLMVPAENANRAAEIINLFRNTRITGRRRLTVAYLMINGVNDTDRHLNELKILLSRTGIRVNLIPFHPGPGSKMLPSPPERIVKFRHELTISGVPASIRRSRGEDISAACGLLASEIMRG